MEILKAEDLSFSYDNKTVLSHLSFSAEKGDFFCITGINGAGKTTLLKLLLKALKPSQGTISIHPDVHKISYVPQKASSFNLSFPATVEEIVSLGLYGQKTDKEKINRALNMVGMYSYKKSLIGKLSGGQQQRVFIAKALVQQPDIMFLDEPTVGIDTGSLGDICCLLGDINKKYQITILIVTHDIASIINHANKVLNFGINEVTLFTAEQFQKNIRHTAAGEESI